MLAAYFLWLCALSMSCSEKAAKGVELLKAFVEREPCTLGAWTA